jgi:Tfp pilus assembly protein PilF
VWVAIDYGNLGVIEHKRGNLDTAEAYYTKSLALNEKMGLKEEMARQRRNLADVAELRKKNADK